MLGNPRAVRFSFNQSHAAFLSLVNVRPRYQGIPAFQVAYPPLRTKNIGDAWGLILEFLAVRWFGR
jgi:hypothetical protein